MNEWWKSLRDMQYQFNKINSARMFIDYKEGNKVPIVGWVVNESQIKDWKNMKKQYADSMKAWDGYYGYERMYGDSKKKMGRELLRDIFLFGQAGSNPVQDDGFTRFGSAPVTDCYWKITQPSTNKYLWDGMIVPRRKPSNNSPTLVFRRYPSLMPDIERGYYDLDILVKALLGFPEIVGYKSANTCKILNDSWVVNLRTTEKENTMMDAFLRGFGGKEEEMRKLWEEKKMGMAVDVSEELKDLLKVYTDAEEHLKRREAEALSSVTDYMKRYIKIQDERKEISNKLSTLMSKIAPPKCDACDEDEQDDEGDE